MLANSIVFGLNRCLMRASLRCARQSNAQVTRCFAAEAAAVQRNERLEPPIPSGAEKQFPQKIKSLVDEISKLNLLEVADLNECLKKTLNIEAAPMMAMGMPMAGAPKAAAAEEEDEAPKQVQTSFTAKLVKFDDTKKVALIKEIKTIVEGMNLVQAKKFVESAPQVLKANLSKDEAEKLKKTLEALGATVEVE